MAHLKSCHMFSLVVVIEWIGWECRCGCLIHSELPPTDQPEVKIHACASVQLWDFGLPINRYHFFQKPIVREFNVPALYQASLLSCDLHIQGTHGIHGLEYGNWQCSIHLWMLLLPPSLPWRMAGKWHPDQDWMVESQPNPWFSWWYHQYSVETPQYMSPTEARSSHTRLVSTLQHQCELECYQLQSGHPNINVSDNINNTEWIQLTLINMDFNFPIGMWTTQTSTTITWPLWVA